MLVCMISDTQGNSYPMPFDPDRDVDRRAKRKLIEFDPKISSGTLLQVAVLLFAMVVGYGAYTSDRAALLARVTQIEKDAEANRLAVKEAVVELRTEVKEVQRSVEKVGQSLAVISAVQEVKQRSDP